jgi:ATP-dependent DNA helicase RecQ
VKSVSIIAMITRYKTDNEEQYQTRCKVEQWEVPMLEVRVTL